MAAVLRCLLGFCAGAKLPYGQREKGKIVTTVAALLCFAWQPASTHTYLKQSSCMLMRPAPAFGFSTLLPHLPSSYVQVGVFRSTASFHLRARDPVPAMHCILWAAARQQQQSRLAWQRMFAVGRGPCQAQTLSGFSVGW